MEREGILEVVLEVGSEWVSPIVAILKPNVSIRVCADYKVGVNSKICNDKVECPVDYLQNSTLLCGIACGIP